MSQPPLDSSQVQASLAELAHRYQCTLEQCGVVVVDHGSRRTESNQLLEVVAEQFRAAGPFSIVEPAHMELAEPSVPTACDRCVARGAKLVIISPFFLLPGKHWTEDLPRLAAEAAERHAPVSVVLAPPLGLHPRLADVLLERIAELARPH